MSNSNEDQEAAGPDVYQLAQAYPPEAVKTRVEKLLRVGVAQIKRERLAGSHAVYFVTLQSGERCVARVATHPEHDLAMELWATEQARASGIPVPETLAADLSPEENAPPLMVSRRIEGRSAFAAPLTPAQRVHVFEQLGRWVARLHGVALPQFGPLVRRNGGYAGRFSNLPEYLLADIADKLRQLPDATLSPKSKRDIQALFAQESVVLERSVGCLLHGDFRFKNVLLQDDAVVGILDFEMALSGDPAMDIAWLLYSDQADRADLQAVQHGYAASSDLDEIGSFPRRLMLYQIRYALVHLWWAAAFRDTEGVAGILWRLEAMQQALSRRD